MTKTALELTPTEWKVYSPSDTSSHTQRGVDEQVEDRWRQARQLAKKASQLLHREFNAEKVILFGSLTNRSSFTLWSDIDLAAWGIASERYYAAVAAVTGLSSDFKIDLVDPNSCRPYLLATIEQDGIEL